MRRPLRSATDVLAMPALFLMIFAGAVTVAGDSFAETGEVLSHQKISSKEGDFEDTLDQVDFLGCAAAAIGDLDGDGVVDLAVGAYLDDDGSPSSGAVWILFLNGDGTMKGYQKISGTDGGFTGGLDEWDYFGCSVAALGDLDGDGVEDIAVGARNDSDSGSSLGAVWILFLDTDGTVKSHQKINSTEGGFTGVLETNDNFGVSLASIGDLDGDGVVDLAAGAIYDNDGDAEDPWGRGAVWILFLNADGTVKGHSKISDTEGNFSGGLNDGDLFGTSVAGLDDLDGDGVEDIAVTTYGNNGADGAVWILFLNTDGTVKGHQKIDDTDGNFTGDLTGSDFGASTAFLGDFDGDGNGDLAVGSKSDVDGTSIRYGAVWLLFLDADGTVKSHQKISPTHGGFAGSLDNGDYFGSSVVALGDLDGDEITDIAVGAMGDDADFVYAGENRGAIWNLFLNVDGTVRAHEKIDDRYFIGTLDNWDQFGSAVTSLGDLDGDGVNDIAVGALYDDDGNTAESDPERRGSVWILFLESDGTVKSYQKISQSEGGFTGALDDEDYFGCSLAGIGDLDGDGVVDLAVGARGDDDGFEEFPASAGAVWILFLNADGTVKGHQKISELYGSFAGNLDYNDRFGSSLAYLGDFDDDGYPEIAVGATMDSDYITGGGCFHEHGAVYILSLYHQGWVVSEPVKIYEGAGGFSGDLYCGDNFGSSVAALGDIDGDGTDDIAVGVPGDDDGGTEDNQASSHGAVYILFMNDNGSVKGHQKISALEGGFTGTLYFGDNFGKAVAPLGDLDGDGVGDLAVGSQEHFENGTPFPDEGYGAIYVFFLNSDGTVKGQQKISDTEGNFTGGLGESDHAFGYSLGFLGDFNSDGSVDIAAGASSADGGPGHGAVWILTLEGDDVAVALQQYGSRWAGDHVEIDWTLAGDESEVIFEVAKAEGADPRFEYVPQPEITRDVNDYVYRDYSVMPGTTYGYRVDVISGFGVVASFETTVPVPPEPVTLRQNYPNPFNPSTTIRYFLPERCAVTIDILDIAGRRVATLVNEAQGAGRYSVEWDGRDAAGGAASSGIYLYRLKAGKETLSRKMILLR